MVISFVEVVDEVVAELVVVDNVFGEVETELEVVV